jgi:hypothetical protein
MKVRELIEALQKCHLESEVYFCLDLESDEGKLVAVEYEINWQIDRGENNPIGDVYLHNTKHDFLHDPPLLEETFFIT